MQRNFRATAKPPEPKDDLLIMKKTREMIAYGHDCLYNKQFPRNQRIGSAIGAQIEKSMQEKADKALFFCAKEGGTR